MKINLFTTIAAMELLQDKESIDFKIQRVGDEFTVMVNPHIADKTTNIVISGTPEELDGGIMAEINKPIEKIKGMKSNADTVEITEDEDDSSEEKPTTKKPTKKATTKKSADNNKTDQEIDADLTKENAQEKANALKAEKEAKAKAAEELLEKKTKVAHLVTESDEALKVADHIRKERLLIQALELLPDDVTLIEKHKGAVKYNNALIAAEILIPRDQWEKEA